MLYNILNIIFDLATWVKFMGLSLISFVTGLAVVQGYLLFLFQSDGGGDSLVSGSWFPAFLGGAGGLLVVIIGQISSHLLERRAERIKEERKEQDERDSQHATFSDKIAELQQEERDKLFERLNKFHDEKIKFKDDIIKELKISEFAAKQREHLAINEVNRLWAHIHMCHAKLRMNNVDIPELVYKNQEEIMSGINKRVNEFAENIIKEEEEPKK